MPARRIILSAALAAIAAHAQTDRPLQTLPRHIAEPIVVADGSVKIYVYSTSETAVVIEKPDTVIDNGVIANKATLLVPTGVIRTKNGIGRLQTGTALAHPMLSIRRYVYEVERLDRSKFVPYTDLVFQFVDNAWHISPKGPNPLRLKGCSAPVALYGAWVNHFQSTCEYGEGNLHLRIGSVTVEPLTGASNKINLATGCSEFRIEPIAHPPHTMTFDHPPCGDFRPDPGLKYPTVRVNGVKSITAIDLSLEKFKAAKE